APGARQPVESAELHAVLASDFHGQRSMNRRSSAASGPAAAGAPMRAGRRAGQQSRKSPDSVRFLRYLQIAEVFFRASAGLLASAPRLHFEIRAAPDSDPGSLFLVGKHRRIAGRIQTRAQIRRHPCRPAGSRVGPPSRARPIPILAACSLFWRLAPADPLAPGLDASLYVAAAHWFSAAELQRSGSSPILSAIAC